MVYNGTKWQLEVAIEPAYTQVYGDKYMRKTVEPGATETVWAHSGTDEDGRVLDFEKYLKNMSEFKTVLILRDGIQLIPRSGLTDPKNWEYKRIEAYEASYTLSVSDSDFY